MTDPLTGLQNRRGMQAALENWRAENRIFSVIALDIDDFKHVNDTYGHDVGDQVIKSLAQIMRESSRNHDVLCRTGGDEFAILLPRVDFDVATRIAERLRIRTELTPLHDLEADVTLHLSIGVSCWHPSTGQALEEVLQMADQALYTAKHQGKNQVVAMQ